MTPATPGPPAAPRIRLCCLDLAGTTVLDDGVVLAAFRSSLDQLGVPPGSPERERMEAYVNATMGTSKIEVFRALFGEESLAQEANAAFEAAYDGAIDAGEVRPVPGAAETIAALRSAGLAVALHTGFSVATRDRLLAALGWQEIADLALCPEEAGRGRPHPDLILATILRLRVEDVAEVAAVGDTAADMTSGRRAGCSRVVGVLTGSDGAGALRQAGASDVVDSVVQLPALLGLAAGRAGDEPAPGRRAGGGSAGGRASPSAGT